MAKKLQKAQMGRALKFLNTAVKNVAKAKPVKELSEFQKARLADGKPLGGNLAEQRAKRELNTAIKNRTIPLKQDGGAPYKRLVGDSTMTSESKKAHPEKWIKDFINKPDKSDSTRKAEHKKAMMDYDAENFKRTIRNSPITKSKTPQVVRKGGQVKSKKK